METELRSLSTTVAENSGKLKNAPVDGSWAKVAKSKLPPQVQRVKSFHGVKKSLPSSPGTVSPGSPLGVSTPERERSPSAKRSRTTSTDSESEMDTVVAADGSFTEGGHNKKDRKRARRKTKAIRGNREDVGEAGLIGGSAEVDIVVSGIRKSQNIASLVAYVNDIGKKEDKDIGLQEANCELLVSKDTTRPPPWTLTVKCSIKREFKPVLLDARFWPNEISVREFVHYRRQQKQGGGSFDGK